jgi:hypothetical protein
MHWCRIAIMAQQPSDNLAREKRDVARRARRLALTLSADADQARLTQFADELDKEAEALERSSPPVSLPPIAITHEQVQQQQSAETPALQVPKEKP